MTHHSNLNLAGVPHVGLGEFGGSFGLSGFCNRPPPEDLASSAAKGERNGKQATSERVNHGDCEIGVGRGDLPLGRRRLGVGRAARRRAPREGRGFLRRLDERQLHGGLRHGHDLLRGWPAAHHGLRGPRVHGGRRERADHPRVRAGGVERRGLHGVLRRGGPGRAQGLHSRERARQQDRGGGRRQGHRGRGGGRHHHHPPDGQPPGPLVRIRIDGMGRVEVLVPQRWDGFDVVKVGEWDASTSPR